MEMAQRCHPLVPGSLVCTRTPSGVQPLGNGLTDTLTATCD